MDSLCLIHPAQMHDVGHTEGRLSLQELLDKLRNDGPGSCRSNGLAICDLFERFSTAPQGLSVQRVGML